MNQQIHKNFVVFQIIAFELGVADSPNLQKDTCPRQSVCQETSLRFHLIIRAIFSESTSLKMKKAHDKSTLVKISEVFGTNIMLSVKACSETALFKKWSDEVFHSL